MTDIFFSSEAITIAEVRELQVIFICSTGQLVKPERSAQEGSSNFIYFFLERGAGKEKEKEISMCSCLMCPQLGTWPTIQAHALTGD